MVADIRKEEPGRLVADTVHERFDLLIDCPTKTIHPGDPDRIVTEIEESGRS